MGPSRAYDLAVAISRTFPCDVTISLADPANGRSDRDVICGRRAVRFFRVAFTIVTPFVYQAVCPLHCKDLGATLWWGPYMEVPWEQYVVAHVMES
jgi:hypothetical protein